MGYHRTEVERQLELNWKETRVRMEVKLELEVDLE